jgi:spore coat polysaccharide biosynthesis protein SpsF
MVGYVIQARMGSERLPGKVLLPLHSGPGASILDKIVSTLELVVDPGRIVLATSSLPENDALAAFAEGRGVKCVRGSEENVLDRFCQAVKLYNFQQIVRLTGDNPFIDPKHLSKTVAYHLDNEADYTHSVGLPLGMNIEVISAGALLRSLEEGKKSADREHITYYARQHPGLFKCLEYNFGLPAEFSGLRLTVDTPSDFILAQTLFSLQRGGGERMDFNFLRKVYESTPEIFEVNAGEVQKKPTD